MAETWEETVRRTRRIVLSEADIRKLLSEYNTSGTTVRVYIKVPSGGDYSGMRLDIDEIGGLHLEVTTEESRHG